MYLVGPHPFNQQPNRQRREMAEFCEQKVLRLLLTVQDDIDDVKTLVDILCEKAEQINRKYPRQAPIKVENRFNKQSGGHVVISVGPDEYTQHVGTLQFYRIRGITNKKFFDNMRRQLIITSDSIASQAGTPDIVTHP